MRNLTKVWKTEMGPSKGRATEGPSIKYFSIFEMEGVSEMLTLADMGGGGLFEMLTSANILHNHGYLY